jgi:hypothetical protein
MFDYEKCMKCYKVGDSWVGKTFAEISKRIIEKLGFAKEYQEAEKHFDSIEKGDELQWPVESGFKCEKISGSRTELVLWFLTAVDFKKEFKFPPKGLGLKLSPWFDENGFDCKGIFFRPNAASCPDTYRRVVLYHDKVWRKTDHQVPPRKRIRLNQAVEAFDSHTANVLRKKRPKDRRIDDRFRRWGDFRTDIDIEHADWSK